MSPQVMRNSTPQLKSTQISQNFVTVTYTTFPKNCDKSHHWCCNFENKSQKISNKNEASPGHSKDEIHTEV
jgi:hypothetical protein